MDLYYDVLEKIYAEQHPLPISDALGLQLAENACCQALLSIQTVLNEERFDDRECFARIEEIVCALESIGSGSSRHDFG